MTVKPGEKRNGLMAFSYVDLAEDEIELTVMTAIGLLYTSEQHRCFLYEWLCQSTAES